MTGTMAATAWYAFAVVGPAGAAVREIVPELEVVGTDELAVVARQVPLSDYGEDVLPDRLNDRVWLERAVRGHEDVVERLASVTTVLPLRFGSLHRDRASIEDFVAGSRTRLAAELARVHGHVELGVKVWRDEPAQAGRPAHHGAASGRDYLERRRAARARAVDAAATLDAHLSEIHRRLLEHAEEGRLNRPQPKELSGAERAMVLNAAYLVADGRSALLDEVARLGTEHPDLDLEVTGPWAPYNFVELEVWP